MLAAILSWMLKSNGAKTAGAAASGSVISVAVLMGIMEKSIDHKVQSVNSDMIRYVDSRHSVVSTELKYMSKDIKEMKDLVKIINQRVYELNLKAKE